jgi:subtilisin family serine protease
LQERIDYHLNLSYDPRAIVGDDYFNDKQYYYGNNDITGPDAKHGTHVSGIIGAVRDNIAGVKGVADHVLLMGLRTVPNGDERDKDVANAIRYAVDNGAKVINMSFGKAYSQDKKAVDDAVKYAMSKDVLLVHAAGNDNKNLNIEANYPNRNYEDGSGMAKAWIEVGASDWKDDETLKAPFSNYGKTAVDVFAPGVKINSTVPGSQYEELSGTSMASPVVTGLAALIREYYPKLSAVQVKDIIMKSVVKIGHNVNVPDGQTTKSLPFADLCISGGVVNAYRALQLADHYNDISSRI